MNEAFFNLLRKCEDKGVTFYFWRKNNEPTYYVHILSRKSELSSFVCGCDLEAITELQEERLESEYRNYPLRDLDKEDTGESSGQDDVAEAEEIEDLL